MARYAALEGDCMMEISGVLLRQWLTEHIRVLPGLSFDSNGIIPRKSTVVEIRRMPGDKWRLVCELLPAPEAD